LRFLRIESAATALRPRPDIPQASPACKPSRNAFTDERVS
jgi:hypothetical protein